MEYSFDVELAKRYGVDEAIMIKSFQYWIRLNKANNSNYYDGHYWTYNTIKALSELFPFWSEKQVRAILQNLLNLKILIKGNYNKLGFDRTIWYAFDNESQFLQMPKKENASNQTVKSICPNGKMEMPKQENGNAQMVNTIPITNTITNSNTNTIKKESKKNFTLVFPPEFTPNLIQKINDFFEYRKEIKKPFKSDKSINIRIKQFSDELSQFGEEVVIASIDNSIANGWQGTFINKELLSKFSNNKQILKDGNGNYADTQAGRELFITDIREGVKRRLEARRNGETDYLGF
jgi:hypothetical protein